MVAVIRAGGVCGFPAWGRQLPEVSSPIRSAEVQRSVMFPDDSIVRQTDPAAVPVRA
jgi:hypothetical protein